MPQPSSPKALGPSHEALQIGLTVCNLLQASTWAGGELDCGRNGGVNAMAIVIRGACRQSLATFGLYDTIPPAVRILLPSSTRSSAHRAQWVWMSMMATVISPTDQRVIIEGRSWATYERLLADFGESHTVRVA